MKGKACLILYFLCQAISQTISACATDDHISRKIAPNWVFSPPTQTEENLYFIGKSTAKSVEEGKKAAAANAVSEIFAFVFGVTGSTEYESQAIREKISGISDKRVAESIKIGASGGSSINLRFADWHWQKNVDGDFDVWILVEVGKKSIARAQEERAARKKQAQELLKKAKELAQKKEIRSAVEILENIDCQTVEEDIKFDCLNAINKVTANIKIEIEKEDNKEISFRVYSKEGKPLSGIPVTCQSREKTSKDWSDAFGFVQCPKTPLTTKIFAQVLAPFGPKTAMEGSLKFTLVRMKNDSPEYKFAFEKFREILLENGVAATTIDIPSAQGHELESKVRMALKGNPGLVIIFELVSCEKAQTYDANDPANYYYISRFNYFVKIDLVARLTSFGAFDKTVEIFSKFASHQASSVVTLFNENADINQSVEKTARLAGEKLAAKFITALADFEKK